VVDRVEYEYSSDTRCSRITFKKTLTGPEPAI
jgi:hypothetical protein